MSLISVPFINTANLNKLTDQNIQIEKSYKNKEIGFKDYLFQSLVHRIFPVIFERIPLARIKE